MPDDRERPPPPRLLVELRPTSALRAAESRGTLRPLLEPSAPAFGVAPGESRWYVAELDAAATHWDLAHERVAERLGVAPSDVLFVEPDLVHSIYPDPRAGKAQAQASAGLLALDGDCRSKRQDGKGGKAVGADGFAWHLGEGFSQLRKAREAVPFDRQSRTRIAHLDTGYQPDHAAAPRHLLRELERSFVDGDDARSASDPDRWRLVLDNSGHGTGTLGILAGGAIPAHQDQVLGGAPEAEIVPLRIADSVVLLRTSAFARALDHAVLAGCDVVSMSMGGLPSRLWRQAVDTAYLKGVVLVCAAGNNFNGLPTRGLVYPARYGRVIAACGVMADGKAYAGLDGVTMEGNFGPKSKMDSAIAAYTPNIPWARFGCPETVDLDGAGTSSATPQVAAAAALWLEKHAAVLPRNWRRVEAVRRALFSSARKGDARRLGNGILRAFRALAVAPQLDLPRTAVERDSWSFLRVLTGLGFDGAPPREGMLELELAQRWLVNARLQELVPDPDGTERLAEAELKKVMEAVIEDEGASLALRRQVAARYPAVAGSSPPRTPAAAAVVPEVLPACDAPPALTAPAARRLRVYASDPSLSARLETAASNEVTLAVRWEELEPGPRGEYLEVEDVDAAGTRHAGVDLDQPRLLARDGWAPSEGNPHFHQQMVYAVAMKTIEHFEHALGRPVLWRARPNPRNANDDSVYVGRLKVHPHALLQANAYYSPEEVALRFGYFDVEGRGSGDLVPGSRVYTCLSHDVVAHETTHAVLDGMFRRFNEPTNPDVLALHEAFADVVSLLQHFTIPEIYEREIARVRGDLEAESRLGSLAVQLGSATSGRGALRQAIGERVGGAWHRHAPDPAELERRLAPHARGAILVAALFDAFLAIHRARTRDLMRIATGGTGVLPDGEIHPDLARRLAGEAAKSARHLLGMCIRALDYLPPVDVTFFEYLRALITADHDLVRDDRYGYRVALVEAFRAHGIHPALLGEATPDTPRTMSVETLRWRGIEVEQRPDKRRSKRGRHYGEIVEELKRYADACFYHRTREELFDATREQRKKLHALLRKAFIDAPSFARELGIEPKLGFEVHELRRALRVAPDGSITPQAIVALTQSRRMAADEARGTPGYVFRGGSTLVVDLAVPEVAYRIVKNIASRHRQARTAAFVRDAAADPLRALFLRPDRREPFALLHSLGEAP